MAGVAFAAMAISSCDEDTLTIGNSLTNEGDKLNMVAEVFPYVTTQTLVADSVLTSSPTCYLGNVKDPETEAEVKSEFTTQFHVLEDLYVSPKEYLHKDAAGEAIADSCDLILYLNSPFKSTGSLSAMKLRIRELGKPVNEMQLFYSDYDPDSLLRKDANALDVSHMFTFTNFTDADSARSKSGYLNNIRIPLNKAYTSTDGKTYSNYGTYILRRVMKYLYEGNKKMPNSYVFAREVCPGFYFEITDGQGFHSAVTNVGLRSFYYVTRPDTAYSASITLAGTKEVLQTIKVTNDKQALTDLAKSDEQTYLKSPAGLFTEVTLPIDSIFLRKNPTTGADHQGDSILSAKLTFQRLNNKKADSRSFDASKNVLMVMKDSLISYFEKGNVPDSKLSYLTTFNSSYNTYSFSNISNLVTSLWNMKQKGLKNDPNWVANHPNWNKVVLVPVTYTTTSTSTTPVSVSHDMSLTSTRLKRGTASNPIEMNVVYAKFNQ